MKDTEIRAMRPEDCRGKAHVHHQSWQESYRGIVDGGYLASMTEEKCAAIAERHPEDTVVAIADGQVVGFACWSPCRDEDLPDAGELQALYLLKPYQGRGIGRALADRCMEELAGYETVVVWVLEENRKAIRFYEKYGFAADGTKKELTMGTPVVCIRMKKCFDKKENL